MSVRRLFAAYAAMAAALGASGCWSLASRERMLDVRLEAAVLEPGIYCEAELEDGGVVELAEPGTDECSVVAFDEVLGLQLLINTDYEPGDDAPPRYDLGFAEMFGGLMLVQTPAGKEENYAYVYVPAVIRSEGYALVRPPEADIVTALAEEYGALEMMRTDYDEVTVLSGPAEDMRALFERAIAAELRTWSEDDIALDADTFEYFVRMEPLPDDEAARLAEASEAVALLHADLSAVIAAAREVP